MTYRYPRTIAEMIPVRKAEIEKHAHEVSDCPAEGHGRRVPRPLEQQTYEQMFCGAWFDCTMPGCYNSQLFKSADLAHQLGEPWHDGQQWHGWDGDGWQPISDAEADAFWRADAKRREEFQRQALQRARSKPEVTYDGKTYKVRSSKTEIPDLASMDRMAALIWLNENTYARGNGIRTRPNPLAGMGGAIGLTVR